MMRGTRAVMPEPYKVTFEEFDVPSPGKGQILVQTEASAVSAGTELAIYTGIHQWLADPKRAWPKFPFVPGYSGVGHVVAVGEGVGAHGGVPLREGDRVVWSTRHETHGLVSADGQSPLHPIASHVAAPAAACAVLARFPMTALVQSGQILGQSVAVMGLGTIGQIATRLFAASGAYPIIGIDPVAYRREVAARTPSVDTLDPTQGDLGEALRETRGALPDIVVDATGAPNTVNAAMHVVADGGKVVMVGSPRGIAGDVDFYWDLHGRSIQLIGAHGSALGVQPPEKFPYASTHPLSGERQGHAGRPTNPHPYPRAAAHVRGPAPQARRHYRCDTALVT
jgi:2-desacetyl-2-hydroxyethyl bacteriochlorophyllide A dehydrogenase